MASTQQVGKALGRTRSFPTLQCKNQGKRDGVVLKLTDGIKPRITVSLGVPSLNFYIIIFVGKMSTCILKPNILILLNMGRKENKKKGADKRQEKTNTLDGIDMKLYYYFFYSFHLEIVLLYTYKSKLNIQNYKKNI